MMRSRSPLADFDSYKFKSNDSHTSSGYDMPQQSNNAFSIKLDIIEATDLPADVNSFCCAWLFMVNEDQNPYPGNDTVSMATLEQYLANVETAPQVRTRALQSIIDPVWRETFVLNEAVLHSRESTRKRLVPLVGKSVMVVVSIHNTLGVFGMEETIGRAYIKDLRPGESVNQWCLLHKSDQQQVLSRTGKPTAIHLKLEYAKQVRNLSWTEATSSEAGLSLVSSLPGLSGSLNNIDLNRIHNSFSPIRRGPLVLSDPKKAAQQPFLAEPPIDLLLQSKAAMTLHQQNLVLAKDVARKDSLAPLLPFFYENHDWHIVEGFSSGDKVVDIPPRRTNKAVVIRSCKGDSTQLVINLQGVTDMVVVENCCNLRLMVSMVSKDIVVSGCQDLELIVGGTAPHLVVVASKQCTVMVCKETWNTSIQSIGCTGIFVHTAHSNGIMDLEPHSLLTAAVMERILLPDILLTQVNLGTITTQCHFSEQMTPVPMNAFSQDAPEIFGSRSAKDIRDDRDRERSPPALYSSQTISDRCGVGMLLRKCDAGFKVEKIARGGPAWKDGTIQEGDVLTAIQGLRTKGKPTRDVSDELAGPENSKVFLSLNRYSASGAFKSFDVTLKRGPLNDEIYFSDRSPPGRSTAQAPAIDNARGKEQIFAERERSAGPTENTRSFAKDSKSVVGVGLGVRPNADGSYSVSGIVPSSSAETCGKIRVGDVLHSVDGVPVCGKPYESVRDLVQGPAGTQVMIAFLRPEAVPSNLYQGLNEFEAWRPVVLTRGLSSSGSSSQQLQSGTGNHFGDQFSSPPVAKGTAGREPIAVALWLNEDYDTIAGDAERKATFSTQLAEDLAASLQTSSRRIIVVDLLKGVVADINLMPDYLEDSRSPESLAKDIANMASDPVSKLRTARTTGRALRAEVRGPVSQVRPLREVFSPEVKPLHLLSDARRNSGDRSSARERSSYNRERSSPNEAASHDISNGNGTKPQGNPQGEGVWVKLGTPSNQALSDWQADLQKNEAERKKMELELQEKARKAEEQARMRKLAEDQELKRKAEEQERTRKLAEEEDRLRKEAEELEVRRKQIAEQERLQKQAAEQERLKRQYEEQERLMKIAEEQDRLRKQLEDQERLQRETEERDRKRKMEIEEQELRRKEAADKERIQKLEQEERERRQRLDDEERERRKRMDDEEKQRRKKMDDEEQERKRKLEDEIRQQQSKLEEAERLKKELEEREKKQQEIEEQERLRKEEEERAKAEQENEERSRKEQEEIARRKEEEAAAKRREEELKIDEERQKQNSSAVGNMSLNIPQISPILNMSAERRSSNLSVTPRVSNDATRKVALIRAPNQGRRVNPGEEVGVGVSFQAARPTNQIVIVSIAPGSSAESSGNVFVGDIIHRIDNISVQGKRIPEIVSLIKGRQGTSVVMELQSSDIQQQPALNITAANLYSSGNYTSQVGYSDGERYNALHSSRSSSDTSTKTITLTRQPITQPGSLPVSPDDLVGVGLGFIISDGAHIISALARGGSADNSNQVHIGDRIISVEGTPAAGKDVDTLVNLIKGRRGTTVRLTLQSPPTKEGTIATSARQPAPPPRLGSSQLSPPQLSPVNTPLPTVRNNMSPTGMTLSTRFSEPRRELIPPEPSYTLQIIVKNANGLVATEPDKVPVAVCNIRLLYPDVSPSNFDAIHPIVPSLDPDYGNKALALPIPASRLKNVQLELTLWDEVSKEKSFMGEVVINISKLSDPGSTLGRAVEHSFVFKQGGTFVPKRPISGSILLELQLNAPQ